MTADGTRLLCQDVVELVTDYLEGALDEERRSALEQHLDRCDGCWQYIEQMRKTIALVGQLHTDDIDPRFLDALTEAFREAQQT